MYIRLGDAFVIDTGATKKHLFVAIAPLPNGAYLFVNASTVRPNRPVDRACILNPSADMHDFIVAESYIFYRGADEYTNAEINTAISNGDCSPRGAFRPSVLRQIQEGGLISKFLTNEYKKHLRSYLNYLQN